MAKITNPLWKHPNGQWCKKIDGKPRYFGVIADLPAALANYETFTKGGPTTGYRLKDLLNSFDAVKRTSLKLGEVNQQSYDQYVKVMDWIAESIGKNRPLESLTVQDFDKLRGDLAKDVSLRTLQNRLIVARMILKHAAELGYRDLQYQRPLRCPAARLLRKARSEQPKKLFTRSQIHTLISAAEPALKAAIFLGINAGFGIADSISLPIGAVQDVLVFPRVKTYVDRRCPLWPETSLALDEAIEDRKRGTVLGLTRNAFTYKFEKLKRATEVKGGFYNLRHTFATIGSETGDLYAVAVIQGHVQTDMGHWYRESVSDEQLRRVTDHVHAWLFNT